jgi:hypothetical protein
MDLSPGYLATTSLIRHYSAKAGPTLSARGSRSTGLLDILLREFFTIASDELTGALGGPRTQKGAARVGTAGRSPAGTRLYLCVRRDRYRHRSIAGPTGRHQSGQATARGRAAPRNGCVPSLTRAPTITWTAMVTAQGGCPKTLRSAHHSRTSRRSPRRAARHSRNGSALTEPVINRRFFGKGPHEKTSAAAPRKPQKSMPAGEKARAADGWRIAGARKKCTAASCSSRRTATLLTRGAGQPPLQIQYASRAIRRASMRFRAPSFATMEEM